MSNIFSPSLSITGKLNFLAGVGFNPLGIEEVKKKAAILHKTLHRDNSLSVISQDLCTLDTGVHTEVPEGWPYRTLFFFLFPQQQ